MTVKVMLIFFQIFLVYCHKLVLGAQTNLFCPIEAFTSENLSKTFGLDIFLWFYQRQVNILLLKTLPTPFTL